MYDDEDVYTRRRVSASGDTEILTVDADNQITTFLVEEYTEELYED